jgi:hypothetical protein
VTPAAPALAHNSRRLVIPSAFVPPSEERARPQGCNVERPTGRTTLCPWGLVCSACPGAKAGGMTRLSLNHPPSSALSGAAIPEPEAPPEALLLPMGCVPERG